MDYYKYSCPVCSRQFTKDDDIVVCPVCGTPHHRDCYEKTMQCHFASRHADAFLFKDETAPAENKPNMLVCHNCGRNNTSGSSFCSGCGTPLVSGEKTAPPYAPYSRHDEESNSQKGHQQPSFQTFAFDPMGGIKSDTDIGKGVTVGEVAKFTKNNTPFYCRLFYQIKAFERSRFSFVGFLFTGGWMLYRKMYKLGTFITVLTAALMLASIYLTFTYNNFLYTAIEQLTSIVYNTGAIASGEITEGLGEFFSSLTTEHQIVLGSYYFINIADMVLQFVCGFCCNRWYYKHCTKKISAIKANSESKEAADAELETNGGVNIAIAISLAVSYLALNFLPTFLS